MNLSENTKQAILKLQKRYPEKRSALIPALHMAQSEKGFLCQKTQAEIASLFDLDPNEVNAIVAFYDMFFDQPAGKHTLRVCKNASCMLRGSDQILEAIRQRLADDDEFSVIPSECLAACDRAPVMIADDKVVGPLNEEQIDALIAEIKRWPGRPTPIAPSEVLDG